MAGALEARLIISAVDESAAAFASVEARIKALQTQLGGVNTLAAGPAGAASVVAGRAAPAAAMTTGAGREPSKSEDSGFFSMAGAGIAAITGLTTLIGAAHEAAAQQHERMRQALADMSPDEIAQAEAKAAELAGRYPSVTQSAIQHTIRTGRTVTGSFDEGLATAEPLTKLRVIAQAASPRADEEEMTGQFDKLVKAMEIAGVTNNPQLFGTYINDIAKALNAFGDQLKPEDYFEMLKYGRQASPALSERFLMTSAATLGTEIGGASIGTAISSFERAVVGGRMGMREGKAMAELGLVDEKDFVRVPGTGEIKGVRRGSHVRDWRLAQSDPDLWVKQDLLPALAAHGVTDPAEIASQISQLFSNRLAADLVTKLATQGPKLEKNSELYNRAQGGEAADTLAKNDISTTSSGASNAIERFLASQMPTDFWAQVMGVVGKGAALMTPPPAPRASFLDDVATDLKGFKDIFGSLKIGWDDSNKGEGWNPFASSADRARAAQLYRDDKTAQGALWSSGYRGDDLKREEDRESRRGSAVRTAAPAPVSVSVDGQAQVEQTIRVSVDASPELKATVDSLKNLRFAIPLTGSTGGATGRMDSDAGPHRGGVGHN